MNNTPIQFTPLSGIDRVRHMEDIRTKCELPHSIKEYILLRQRFIKTFGGTINVNNNVNNTDFGKS